MAEHAIPPQGNLRGMFLGAVVPFELVGEVFKFFYLIGLDPKNFEQAPAYDQAHVAAAVQAALNGNGSVPQIAHHRKRASSTYGGGLKGRLLTILSEKPRTRQELTGFLKDTRWSPKSLDSRLYDLKHDKLITFDGTTYTITDSGIAFIRGGKDRRISHNKEEKPGRKPMTQVEFVERYASKAWPKAFELLKLKTVFTNRGWRPESASVALNVLQNAGKVLRVDAGVYQWVKQEKAINGDQQS